MRSLLLAGVAVAALAPPAQAARVYTLAGGGAGGGSLAGDRAFDTIGDVAMDARGDVAFTEPREDRVRIVSPAGAVRTVHLRGLPQGIALEPDGTPLVAHDSALDAIEADGRLRTIAGRSGSAPASGLLLGDGLPATQALLELPESVSRGPDGSVYVADLQRVRRIAPDGTISTVAGTGAQGSDGDGGPAALAAMTPYGVAATADGSLYILDGARLRRVSPQGTIAAVPGVPQDLGSIAAAPDSSVLLTEPDAARVLRLAPGGALSVIAGTGSPGFSGDGGPATAAALNNPLAIASAPDGSAVFADTGNHRVRRIRPDGGIETVAGTGVAGYAGDGGPALAAQLTGPVSVAVTPDGAILALDDVPGGDGSVRNVAVRRIAPDGTIVTLAGGSAGPLGADFATGLAALPDGGFLVSDANGKKLLRGTPGGALTTFAGGGDAGLLVGDGGPALGAAIDPLGIALGSGGAILIAEENARVRRIAARGTIETLARPSGADWGGASPDPAQSAWNAGPVDIAQAREGVLVATHRRVRRIAPTGAIRTLAGNGRGGDPADGMRATRAPLEPAGIAALARGGFVVSTLGGALLRIGRDGRVHALAGGLAAQLGGVAADADGGIAYADGSRVRYIAPKHPHRLAVAVAGVRGGRVRAETTRRARIRLELWRGRRRLAAGSSIRAPHARGTFRIRAVARAGRAQASAQGGIVLGGRLTASVATAALGPATAGGVSARTADPPGPFRTVAACRRHGARRLDCEIDSGEEYEVTCTSRGEVILGRDALVRARESSCMKHPFRGRARWLAGFAVAPLI